jgi:hypothetical protein
MANTFKNILYETTNSLTTFYTAPASAGAVAIVIGCQAANINNASQVSLTLAVDDGVDVVNIVEGVTIPQYASLGPVSGKLVLEAGHELQASSVTTGDVGIVLSVLEIT